MLLICNAFDVKPASIVVVEVSSLTGDLGDGINGANEGGDGSYEHSGSESGTHFASSEEVWQRKWIEAENELKGIIKVREERVVGVI